MTDQSTVFDTSTTTNTQEQSTTTTPDQGEKTVVQPTVDVNAIYADQLSAIKNQEGSSKYSTVTDALHALKASQEYISTLETENSSLRDAGVKAKTTDEILGLLDSNKNKSDDNRSQFDAETIKELVNSTVNEREQVTIAQSNQDSVASALTKTYGDKAEEMYVKKAEELGISVDTLNSLASTSPKAALAYFVEPTTTQANTNITSSVNTENFNRTDKNLDPNIMFGASSTQMIDLWRDTAKSVELQN